MTILGIESTCDETSVGIVKSGTKVLANVVASSSVMHKKYGGIVPEVAAREQVRVIVPVLQEALRVGGCTWRGIDAIAVAYGPGLIGSLLIGVETAKALALAWDKPLIGVNHLVGHLYANWIKTGDERQGIRRIQFPAIGLVVSGGHTDLIMLKSHKEFKWLGGTLDDAAGEVFDKVARVVGLTYPGGPEIEKAAGSLKSQRANLKFPVPMTASNDLNFSFSGLKTSVVNYIASNEKFNVPTVAYAFQNSVIKSLVKKTFAAVAKYKVKSVVVGGGVAANEKLRAEMQVAGEDRQVEIYFPQRTYSIDNGAMIAAAAYFQKSFVNFSKLQADPSLYFV